MVVPFGVSVGDFIAGIRLLKGAVESFSSTRGARADYVELRKCLSALEIALDAANKFTTPLHQAAIQPTVTDCKACIAKFLTKVAKFDLLRDKSITSSTLRSGLRKIQWSSCEKEKVLEFKQHLTSHISGLQLHLLVFNVNAQAEAAKAAEASNASVDGLVTATATSLNMQKELAKTIEDVPSQLSAIRQQLHYGLSPDEQRNMFRLLEEALTERNALYAKMEVLVEQNKTLETHLIELKNAVLEQKEIPAQVMLRRPVVLIDAFEENRLPFHLEFIDSFEALFAVFMIRFRDKGRGTLDRLRRQWFDMVETSRQHRVDFQGSWANAFKPGQFIEMCMLVPASSSLAKSQCPGCQHRGHKLRQENEKVKCNKCPMTYRWSQRSADVSDPSISDVLRSEGSASEDELISYCRVDIIESPARLEFGSKTLVWYCEGCCDGPYGSWQPVCQACGHTRCESCIGEEVS